MFIESPGSGTQGGLSRVPTLLARSRNRVADCMRSAARPFELRVEPVFPRGRLRLAPGKLRLCQLTATLLLPPAPSDDVVEDDPPLLAEPGAREDRVDLARRPAATRDHWLRPRLLRAAVDANRESWERDAGAGEPSSPRMQPRVPGETVREAAQAAGLVRPAPEAQEPPEGGSASLPPRRTAGYQDCSRGSGASPDPAPVIGTCGASLEA